MSGRVYLVGAGPGDPGLITVKGRSCIERADVLVYDRLAHPSLLNYARADAEKVYVGKQSARHAMVQEDINALIVDRALKGKIVCRLKGGDPFVFGRGGEEAEECLKAGVPFEIVPGVTSAIAGPAYAGIPVTHRDAASSFAVITGHERDDRGEAAGRPAGEAEQRRDWSKIAHAADTLVFLMGVENIGEIAANLQKHGRSPATPVALVRWGTWSRQQVLASTLADVAADVQLAGFTAPAVTVVGEVVRLRERLRWFDNRPLFGKRILVTRAREQASGLSELLAEHGAEPVEFPVIRTKEPGSFEELDAAIDSLRDYSWALFTSANAVESFRSRLESKGQDSRALYGCRIAAIGAATAEALSEMGIRPDFVPSRFVAEAAAEEWPDPDMSSKAVLFPRAKEARELLPERLREMGARVDIATAYETVLDAEAANEIRKEILDGAIDAVTFTSSSTVKNFVESIGSANIPDVREKLFVASIGPATSATAVELGLPPNVEAAEHTIPGLVQALLERFSK